MHYLLPVIGLNQFQAHKTSQTLHIRQVFLIFGQFFVCLFLPFCPPWFCFSGILSYLWKPLSSAVQPSESDLFTGIYFSLSVKHCLIRTQCQTTSSQLFALKAVFFIRSHLTSQSSLSFIVSLSPCLTVCLVFLKECAALSPKQTQLHIFLQLNSNPSTL